MVEFQRKLPLTFIIILEGSVEGGSLATIGNKTQEKEAFASNVKGG